MMSKNIKSHEKLMVMLLPLLISLFNCSSQDKKISEYVFIKDTLKNGLILVKGLIIDGKKEGLWNEYNNDGTLFVTECYKGNKLNGQYVAYREYGWIFTIGQYKDDLKEGAWITFNKYPSDTLFKRYYSKGKKVGIWEEYDDHNGRLRLRLRYGLNEKEEVLVDNRLPVPN